MPPPKKFEIAIVGGGIAGLTLAIALHKRNIPCKVYEQASKFGEIGAGVSFSPNAVQAMKICDHGIYEAFEAICTRNLWESKQDVWFDYLNGYDDPGLKTPGPQQAAFTIRTAIGQAGVYRAAFLDKMVLLVPKDIAVFGKRLNSISEGTNGKLVMKFQDGSEAEADAIVGCDGIKSRVRQLIVGEDHPSAHPVYTHKYAYRGLIPMEDAVKAIGEERAQNACMHMGPDGHILTFSVQSGKVMNLVGFRTDANEWPDFQKLTRPAKREDALRDYAGYGPNVMELIKLCKSDLDVWAIFDTGDHPVPTFYKGRVCVSGDAAHATSPHHGAGAGFCIEDSAVLAELLDDESVQNVQDLEAVFAAFDASRKERTQWLVQSSRRIGDCYEWRAEGVGRNFDKIEEEINTRYGIIANGDVEKMCGEAKETLQKMLTAKTSA